MKDNKRFATTLENVMVDTLFLSTLKTLLCVMTCLMDLFPSLQHILFLKQFDITTGWDDVSNRHTACGDFVESVLECTTGGSLLISLLHA